MSHMVFAATVHCCCGSAKVTIDYMQMKECGCVSTKLYFLTLKFEFHIIFHVTKWYYFDFSPPHHFKMQKSFLAHGEKQNRNKIWTKGRPLSYSINLVNKKVQKAQR